VVETSEVYEAGDPQGRTTELEEVYSMVNGILAADIFTILCGLITIIFVLLTIKDQFEIKHIREELDRKRNESL
jgi:hypothetical protein